MYAGETMMITPWVLRLIIANVAVFLATMASPELFRALMLVPALALTRPWTLVTYMFLHGGIGHILFNMLGLYFFGPRLEERLGGRHFLGLYFASGISGALLSFLTPNSAIVGASGAVFGIFLASAIYWPRERVYIWGILPVESRVLVAVMTILALYGGFSGSSGGIAHFAHLGGFAGGYLYLKWASWSSPAARFKRRSTPSAARSVDLEQWSRIRREDLHPVNREELDRVLAKIDVSGAGSLNDEERAFLNRFSPR